MHYFFSIKFAYEKYILHRNKQSFQKKIHLSHIYRETLYFIVSPIFYIAINTYQNNAHHNKHSLSKQSPHFGHITHYKGQITDGPQYNKCWNLEFLQDNSKALPGRCLEEWITTLQNCERTGDKITSI